MQLKLRPATADDAPILTEILRRSRALQNGEREAAQSLPEDTLISDATIATVNMTVAELDGQPVAFSGLSPQGDDTAFVDFLFVAPEAQRRGIGELLLIRAEDQARWNNHSRVSLEADAQAAGFYERRGYTALATRPRSGQPGECVPLMEKILPPGVARIDELDISVSNETWAFEELNKDAIAAHFEDAKKRIGMLWNGRTLKLTGYSFQNGIFRGKCTETSYAAFLAWRDWGAPDTTAFNLFGSAILRSAEGALLYGVMAGHTATAGLIYPPGGNLDPSDLAPDGRVDVLGAINRELEEETGMRAEELRPGELLAAFDGPRISIARVFDSSLSSADLRRRIVAYSCKSSEQELADMVVIRNRADLSSKRIVPYARAIADYLLP